MRIGPLWIGLAREHVVEREQNTIDFGGVKIARELIPSLLAAADGALVLTRDGKRLRIARSDPESFVVTEMRD